MNLRATYLFIINCRIADFYRKQGRRKEELVAALPETEATTEDPDSDGLDAAQVVRLLNVLNLRQQQVFQLHYFQGLSTGEIARRLDEKEGTVCSDLFHGRKKLLKALESGSNRS